MVLSVVPMVRECFCFCSCVINNSVYCLRECLLEKCFFLADIFGGKEDKIKKISGIFPDIVHKFFKQRLWYGFVLCVCKSRAASKKLSFPQFAKEPCYQLNAICILLFHFI